MSDTTYYYVEGLAEPFWAVTADRAVSLDADTDMGDLSVDEFTNMFLPYARRITQAQAWARNSG